MLRLVFSHVLIALILVSQVGVPMHFHYCKGALESVSILFSKACEDDKAIADMPECCKKLYQKHCSKDDNGCCHDQVKVLNQDLTSLAPSFIQWMPIILENNNLEINFPGIVSSTISLFSLNSDGSDSGPPIYIRYHSLIYYA